jgi:nicotinamidase-related amidase
MNYTEPELTKSALITIDTQCDFFVPGAPAEVAGTPDVIPNIVRLLDAYRGASLPVIHIVRLYLADGSNADVCRREMVENGACIVQHCPRTTVYESSERDYKIVLVEDAVSGVYDKAREEI